MNNAALDVFYGTACDQSRTISAAERKLVPRVFEPPRGVEGSWSG